MESLFLLSSRPVDKPLAIFDHAPAFSEPLHVGRPNIGDQACFNRLTKEIFASRRFTNYGPMVQEFERQIAELTRVEHCIVMVNATSALTLTALALGLTGSVVVPAFGFIATAHAMRAAGLRIQFADIDRATHHLSVDSLFDRVASDTTAIVAVNLWGNPCEVHRLERFCRDRDLKLIFDSAQAFGSTFKGIPLGGFGDAEIFSFHATKAINSFEGGAVTTNSVELATKLRLFMNFGFSGEDAVETWGINAKMPEICAAMGLASLADMDAVFSHNLQNNQEYEKFISEITGVSLLSYRPSEISSRNYITLIVEDSFPLTRDELFEVLRAENILARKYFNPAGHRASPYRDLTENRALHMPVTEEVCRKVLCLPTGRGVRPDDVRRICDVIERASAQAERVRNALRAAIPSSHADEHEIDRHVPDH